MSREGRVLKDLDALEEYLCVTKAHKILEDDAEEPQLVNQGEKSKNK